MSNHVLQTLTHRAHEKHDEINQEDRPEDRYVEYLPHCQKQGNGQGARGAIPGGKFRELANEGPIFVIVGRGEFRLVRGIWVLERAEEIDQDVEKIDAEPITNNIPASPVPDSERVQ